MHEHLQELKKHLVVKVISWSTSIDYSSRFASRSKDFKQAYSTISQAVSPIVTPATQILAGTATATALAGLGYFNYLEAAENFQYAYCSHFSQQYGGMTFRSQSMMQKILETHFDPTTSAGLNQLLLQQGWFRSDSFDIEHLHCEKINSLDFGQWKDFQEATIAACELVQEDLPSESLAEKEMKSLEENLNKIVYGNIRRQFQNDVVSNAANAIGRLTSRTIAERVAEYVEDITMQNKVKEVLKPLHEATKEDEKESERVERQRKEQERKDLRENEKRLREKILHAMKDRKVESPPPPPPSSSSSSSSMPSSSTTSPPSFTLPGPSSASRDSDPEQHAKDIERLSDFMDSIKVSNPFLSFSYQKLGANFVRTVSQADAKMYLHTKSYENSWHFRSRSNPT